jgi:AraC-like DNA-binding protein
MKDEFVRAVDAAFAAIRDPDGLSDVPGGKFELRVPATVSATIRSLILSSPDFNWTAAAVVSKVATSEAMSRRHSAEEGTTLSDLVTDIRISFAEHLLQL